MKIGILGSTGFVGSNLVDYFMDNKVTCVGGSRRLRVDARNYSDVLNWIITNKITHVVNLAAECGGIGLNQRKPADLWAVTTAISHTVLEACRMAGVQKLIMVGTVCSYPHTCPIPFRESYLLQYGEPEPTNRAYGIAKLNSLYGAQAYAAQYGMKIGCLIPVNMYGRHDNFDDQTSHVIPALIKKFYEAKTKKLSSVTLWGTGTPTREFLHARDFAKAVHQSILLLEEPVFINVGSGREVSIKALASLIATLMRYEGDIIWDESKPDGQPRRSLDVSRAKNILDFKAMISLEEGLSDLVRWYHEKTT